MDGQESSAETNREADGGKERDQADGQGEDGAAQDRGAGGRLTVVEEDRWQDHREEKSAEWSEEEDGAIALACRGGRSIGGRQGARRGRGRRAARHRLVPVVGR